MGQLLLQVGCCLRKEEQWAATWPGSGDSGLDGNLRLSSGRVVVVAAAVVVEFRNQ